ncbi:hypothetical protein ACFQ60_13845 [Streptomyces zhihengii]
MSAPRSSRPSWVTGDAMVSFGMTRRLAGDGGSARVPPPFPSREAGRAAEVLRPVPAGDAEGFGRSGRGFACVARGTVSAGRAGSPPAW